MLQISERANRKSDTNIWILAVEARGRGLKQGRVQRDAEILTVSDVTYSEISNRHSTGECILPWQIAKNMT